MSEIVRHSRCKQCDRVMGAWDLEKNYFVGWECIDKLKCEERVEKAKAFRRALLSRLKALR